MKKIIRNTKPNPDKKDCQEARNFVKIIHLKLKNHKPQDRKVMSLYDVIVQ